MSSPPLPYTRKANFISYEGPNPTKPKRGTDLDAEFDDIERALGGTQARLSEIQRDDGGLKNGVVTPESLSAAVSAELAKASTALSQSASALSAANSAASVANEARSTANAADSKARSAQSLATTAAANASSALSTANTAASVASSAKADASQAIGVASSARSRADSAIKLITEAGGNVQGAEQIAYAADDDMALARTARDKMGDTLHARDFVSNFSTDATDQVRALHDYANATGLSVSYQGVASINLQADAQIDINTDVDFAGCEIRLLNGIVETPVWGGHNILFRIHDPDTPYELTSLARADCSLRKGEHVPFGTGRAAGYYLLRCNYLISNRDKNGTDWYEQSFRLDGEGTAQFPLSAEAGAATSVAVYHRGNSARGPIHVRGARFRASDFNNQQIFSIQRNQVHVSGIGMKDYETEPGSSDVDITAFFKVDNCADVTISDMTLPGRPKWSSGGTTSGGYLLNPDGAANLTIRDVRASTRNSVMGSNRVNGVFIYNCILNRIDVHASGHNIFVENTQLHHRGIAIGWGGGKIYARNVTTYNAPILTDRTDYCGSFFGGHVVVENCEMHGTSHRSWFAVEFCAFSYVSPFGVGVGSPTETFLPDSIVIRNVTRRLPLPAGGTNYVVGGLRTFTHASRPDIERVYAPSRVVIDGVRLEGTGSQYRFGTHLALREMWPGPNGPTIMVVRDCPSAYPNLTASNTAGVTLYTGTSVIASPNGPTQSQSARVRADFVNCSGVYINSTVTGGQYALARCEIQRIACASTDGSQRQGVSIVDSTLLNPIILDGETAGRVEGFNPNAHSPCALGNVRVLGNFDLSGANLLHGVVASPGGTITLPSGVTMNDAFLGWRHGSHFQ